MHNPYIPGYLPEEAKATIDRYVEHRCPTGGFIHYVLCNNLRESFALADQENAANLFHIVNYLHNEVPSNCWGTPEKVEAWYNDVS